MRSTFSSTARSSLEIRFPATSISAKARPVMRLSTRLSTRLHRSFCPCRICPESARGLNRSRRSSGEGRREGPVKSGQLAKLKPCEKESFFRSLTASAQGSLGLQRLTSPSSSQSPTSPLACPTPRLSSTGCSLAPPSKSPRVPTSQTIGASCGGLCWPAAPLPRVRPKSRPQQRQKQQEAA